jgi:polar amino acid transport system substrate-binding protein
MTLNSIFAGGPSIPEVAKMNGKFILIIFFLAALLLGTYGDVFCSENQPQSEITIVFATIFPESVSFYKAMSLIYTEAFRRLGYHFKLVSLPGERAMVDANSGFVDGEAARISYLDSEKYPNLIRVPEPVIVMQDGAYATDTSIRINGYASLKGKGFKVGLFKGIKSVEEKLPRYVEKENIVTLIDFEQALKMLQSRRIDLIIGATLIEESDLMKSAAYKDIQRVGILEEKIAYPWFNKRHKELVSRLANTLKAMKAEGTFQKLMEDSTKN